MGNKFTQALGAFGSMQPNAVPYVQQHMDELGQLLGSMGVSLPDHIRQNVFLPETGFFGNHPGLTRGIENAVLAAASMGPSATVGEGISNVARSMIAVPQMRQQYQMQ